jgi:uncharacterized membrane protein YoaK (UPF0700 family)
MEYIYIFAGLFIFHLGIINSIATVAGRYNSKTLLGINSIMSDRHHVMGVISMIIAGAILGVFLDSQYTEIAFCIAAVLTIFDIILVYKAIKSS